MEKTNGSTPKLHFGRLTEASHARRVMRANIPVGMTVEDILKTDYLSHHTGVLQNGDILEAACEDGSWMAWLWVMFVGRSEVHLAEIWSKSFNKIEIADQEDDYYCKYVSPTIRYAVKKRQPEGMPDLMIEGNIQTPELADKKLAEYRQTIGR